MHSAQESPSVHRQGAHLSQGAHCCRPVFAITKLHLTEHFSGTQHRHPDLASLLRRDDFDLALLDHVHAVPQFPLAHDDIAVMVKAPEIALDFMCSRCA